METFFELNVCPTREPIESSHNIYDYRKCFFINFVFNHASLPSQVDTNPNLTTTIKEVVIIPIEILCNCVEEDYNSVLYDNFSFVPIDILDAVLPNIKECARQMVALHGEECDILEVNMHLYATTPIEEEEEEDLRNQDDYDQAQQVVDSMEKLENCYLFFTHLDNVLFVWKSFAQSQNLFRQNALIFFIKIVLAYGSNNASIVHQLTRVHCVDVYYEHLSK